MSDSSLYNLVGRTALVTGAARRIGASIAATLHAAGANAAIHYRGSEADAIALSRRFSEVRPGSSQTFQADLNDPGGPERLLEKVLAWSGRLDVLVNNASSFYPTPLGEVAEDAWLDLIGSNLKAPLFLAQAAAPHLRAAGGSIVNIVDIHARRPLRDYHVYGAAKAGLVMLTRSLARDLAPEVRVNGVAPGAIAWPENGMSDAAKANILRRVPLGRSGSPEDIANAVLFLITEATYSTGQVVAIDGGRSLGW